MQNPKMTLPTNYEQLKLETIHNDIIEAQKNANMYDYLLVSRGITQSVQERFGVGYIPNWSTVNTRINANFDESLIPPYKKSPRLIIKTSVFCYTILMNFLQLDNIYIGVNTIYLCTYTFLVSSSS